MTGRTGRAGAAARRLPGHPGHRLDRPASIGRTGGHRVETPCPFYEHTHGAEAWDAIDEAIMACRKSFRAEVGDLCGEEPHTVTTEMGIADTSTLVMPCLHCGAVTVLDRGICGKCADTGRPRVA